MTDSMVGRYAMSMEEAIGPAFIPSDHLAECENCCDEEVEICMVCWFCKKCHVATLCDEVTA